MVSVSFASRDVGPTGRRNGDRAEPPRRRKGAHVRRPLLAVACAIVLQLALLQAARAGDHPAGPASMAAATTTTAPQNPGRHLGWCDPQPPHGKDVKGHRHCPNTTTTTTTTTTTATTATTTTMPKPPPRPKGTFTREPASGPVGTVIHVASVTPSALGGDQIAIVALVKRDPAPIAIATFAVNRNGAWHGAIVVPSDAAVGDYLLMAETKGAAGEFFYNALPFNVVPSGAPPLPSPSPPPPPVPGPPPVTG